MPLAPAPYPSMNKRLACRERGKRYVDLEFSAAISYSDRGAEPLSVRAGQPRAGLQSRGTAASRGSGLSSLSALPAQVAGPERQVEGTPREPGRGERPADLHDGDPVAGRIRQTLCTGGGDGRLVRRARRSCPFDPVVQLDVFEGIRPEEGVPFMVHRLHGHCCGQRLRSGDGAPGYRTYGLLVCLCLLLLPSALRLLASLEGRAGSGRRKAHGGHPCRARIHAAGGLHGLVRGERASPRVAASCLVPLLLRGGGVLSAEALPNLLHPRPCGVYLSPRDQRPRGADGGRVHGAGLDGGVGARADGHCRPCRPLGAGRLPEVFIPEVKRLSGLPRAKQGGEFLKPLSNCRGRHE